MQISGQRVHVKQAGHHLAACLVLLHVPQGGIAVSGVVVGVQFAQAQHGAVMLLHLHHFAGRVVSGDLVTGGDEVDAADSLVVLAHVVVALGAAAVVVEGDTRADDINEGCATMRHGSFDEWHQLCLVARETARHIGGTQLQRNAHQVDRAIAVDHAFFALGAAVCRG